MVGSTTTMQRESGTSQGSAINASTHALDAKQIRALQLADGWHEVADCQFLAGFAVGQATSPVSPTKLYPALRYKNERGQEVVTPLSQIISFSPESSTAQY